MSNNGKRLERLFQSAVVWDNHSCMPLREESSFLPQLERYRRAGVSVVSLNAGFGPLPWEEHIAVLSHMRRWIALHPAYYRLVSTADDLERSKCDGKLGVVFDIEGMGPVLEKVSLIQTFYELGARWMLVAYNRSNSAGGGCLDPDAGLTAVGRSIIDEMERVGMVLCLSHTGARTAREAIEYARNPVIFSHANPYGDHPHPRNVSDELMRACAAKGGVIGLTGAGPFLGEPDNLVERLLRQLHYVIDRIGPEHVGLSLDYQFDSRERDEWIRRFATLIPAGMATPGGLAMIGPEGFGAIAEGLAKSNLTDAAICGILGNNWLRIAKRVWR